MKFQDFLYRHFHQYTDRRIPNINSLIRNELPTQKWLIEELRLVLSDTVPQYGYLLSIFRTFSGGRKV